MKSFAFNPQEQDFRRVFTRARALHPDAIYSPITDNLVTFYSQLKLAAPGIPVVSSDVIAEEHVRQSPTSFEGVYQSQMRDPHGVSMVKLAEVYEKKFGKKIALPWYVATGYDGVKLIAKCLDDIRGSAIRDCIAATKDLPGVSQTLSFNPGGSSPQIESIFQLKNGEFQFVWQQ